MIVLVRHINTKFNERSCESMRIGVAYYPEHHHQGEWPVHFRQMQEAGIERIRIGEFAWSAMEPHEGQYSWDWLDRSIELADQHGIQVVLCTPTAAPPIWLVEKHPDVLPINKFGKRLMFGKRQHRCYNSPAYNEYSAHIVEELGKRYGTHPNVVAWQLDNEFGGEQKECYCDYCRKVFQEELVLKYHTIDELNRRWGNTFWSQNFERFDQVPVPLKIDPELSLKYNPSLELEFARFSSRSIVRYSRMQAQIIRKYSTNIPITTNTDSFYYGDNVNLVNLFSELNIGGIDIYSQRLYEIFFYADFMASLKNGRFWMMEYGVTSPNLYNEMSLLQEHGCEWLYFFKFNPFPAGQEQGENGLLTFTGELTPAYHAIRQWAQNEVSAAEKPVKEKNPSVGLYYHFDSSWTYSIASWGSNIVDRQVYPKYLMDIVYRSLYEENIPVRFVFSQEEIQGLKLLIVPLHIIYDTKLEEALISFVEKGGQLIVTSDLFRKNEDNVYLTKVPRIFSTLFGYMENDFIKPSQEHEEFVVINKSAGYGHVWMIRQDATLGQWKELVSKIRWGD